MISILVWKLKYFYFMYLLDVVITSLLIIITNKTWIWLVYCSFIKFIFVIRDSSIRHSNFYFEYSWCIFTIVYLGLPLHTLFFPFATVLLLKLITLILKSILRCLFGINRYLFHNKPLFVLILFSFGKIGQYVNWIMVMPDFSYHTLTLFCYCFLLLHSCPCPLLINVSSESSHHVVFVTP